MRSLLIILILIAFLISLSFLQQIQNWQNLSHGSTYQAVFVLPYISPDCSYHSRYLRFIVPACQSYGDNPALSLIGTVEEYSDSTIFSTKRLIITGISSYQPSLYSFNDWTTIIELRLSLLRTWLYQLVLDSTYPLQAGFVIALLFGVTDWLNSSIEPYFENTGTLHILAASGSHVALVLGVVTSIVRQTPLKPKGLILIVALLAYQLLLGDSPSITRAIAMSLLMLVARFFLLRQASVRLCLVWGSGLLLVWRPEWIYSIGFQLSVFATAGIVVIYPLVARVIGKHYRQESQIDSLFSSKSIDSIGSYFKEQLLLGFCAQLTILPLLLFHFEKTPLLGFVATAAVGWFVPYLMESLMLGVSLQAVLQLLPFTEFVQRVAIVILVWTPVKFFISLMALLSKASWLEWGIPHE